MTCVCCSGVLPSFWGPSGLSTGVRTRAAENIGHITYQADEALAHAVERFLFSEWS
jgi:hypothetical protein